MKLDKNTLDHIEGKSFSNSLAIQYDYYEPIPKRIDLLKRLAKDKNIIHLGCLDHLPLIDEKIARQQWLHQELTNAAKVCIGIDVNEEALQHVKTKYGVNNILIGDFTQTRFQELENQRWDYAILGELLEHIDNPVSFLNSIKKNYQDNLDQIVITVPNAWTQNTIKNALRSREVINSDHRYWFTPYTLAHVITKSGLTLQEIHFANRIPLSFRKLASRKILTMLGMEPRYNFTYASSIVAIARLK